MAGRGRGRGRGAVLYNADKQLPKPGESTLKADLSSVLPNLIKSLPLEATNTELVPLVEMVAKHCDTEDKKEQVFSVIYSECQKNWKFSCSAAEFCKRLVANDESFRSVILVTLRREFNEKEKLRATSEDAYLGWLALFCQIFSKIHTQNGPMEVLAQPIAEVLDASIGNRSNVEEISCFASQFLATGPYLHGRVTEAALNKILQSVREVIINGDGTKEARLELVDVLEGFASDWEK